MVIIAERNPWNGETEGRSNPTSLEYLSKNHYLAEKDGLQSLREHTPAEKQQSHYWTYPAMGW